MKVLLNLTISMFLWFCIKETLGFFSYSILLNFFLHEYILSIISFPNSLTTEMLIFLILSVDMVSYINRILVVEPLLNF